MSPGTEKKLAETNVGVQGLVIGQLLNDGKHRGATSWGNEVRFSIGPNFFPLISQYFCIGSAEYLWAYEGFGNYTLLYF